VLICQQFQHKAMQRTSSETAALAMQLEIREKELEVLKSTKSDHDDRIEQYKSQLQDKDEIISMLKEQIRQLKH